MIEKSELKHIVRAVERINKKWKKYYQRNDTTVFWLFVESFLVFFISGFFITALCKILYIVTQSI